MAEPVASASIDHLVARAAALVGGGRAILGITGCPGAGKSTLAELLLERLPGWAARVQMDGFHLADLELERLGRRSWKGAIDTFDAFGYLASLRRLTAELHNAVYVPDFDRTIEQPVAGSVAIGPDVRLVITEGNYLLDLAAPWPDVRATLREVWYVDLDDRVRLERLLRRHVQFGKSEAAAREWVARVDEANAERIREGRSRADVVVDMAGLA